MNAVCVWILLFIVTCSLQLVRAGIHCYDCQALPSDYSTKPLCADFDGTSKFEVYCGNSTFCVKNTIRYTINNRTAVVIYRGCAPQVYEGLKLNEVRRKYEHIAPVVENAYEEGCTEGGDSGSPTGPSEFCYCRFHLCNGKSSIVNSMDLYGSIVLGIFIIELTCVQSILNNLL